MGKGEKQEKKLFMLCTPELVKNILMFTYHSSQTDRRDICNDFISREKRQKFMIQKIIILSTAQ